LLQSQCSIGTASGTFIAAWNTYCSELPDIEVMVIDNGSRDGSLERVKLDTGRGAIYRELREHGVRRRDESRHCVGCWGVYRALDQDVCLHQDSFPNACDASCKMKNWCDRGRVYSWIGDELTDILRKGEGEKHSSENAFRSMPASDRNRNIGFWSGRKLSFSSNEMLRDVRRATGDYYDESFVTGWEDTDLWFRLQLRGWRCYSFQQLTAGTLAPVLPAATPLLFEEPRLPEPAFCETGSTLFTKNLPPKVFFRLAPHLVATELAMIPYFMIRSPSSIVAFMLHGSFHLPYP